MWYWNRYLLSSSCKLDWKHAVAVKKRIIPVVVSEINWDHVPAQLAALNFIFATNADMHSEAVNHIVAALNFDLGRVERHTYYLLLATKWKSVCIERSRESRSFFSKLFDKNPKPPMATSGDNSPGDKSEGVDDMSWLSGADAGDSLLLQNEDLDEALSFQVIFVNLHM